MSFNILSLPPPVTVPVQVETAILNIENTQNNGSYLKMVTLDTNNKLSYRNVQSGMGEIFLNNNSTQLTLPSSTPTLLALASFQLNIISRNFDMSANGRLRYTGTDPLTVHITANLSAYSTVNNQNMRFTIARNGVLSTNAVVQNVVSNNSAAQQSVTFGGVFTCNANDYFEIFIENIGSNNPCIVSYCNLRALTIHM